MVSVAAWREPVLAEGWVGTVVAAMVAGAWVAAKVAVGAAGLGVSDADAETAVAGGKVGSAVGAQPARAILDNNRTTRARQLNLGPA